MKHPEEIYKDFNGKKLTDPERLWGEGMYRRHAYDLGHEAGYAKCLADRADQADQSDPLDGYSNLTAAISAGEPIDYEKLDGLKVQCVNPDVGESRGVLKRDYECFVNHVDGWWVGGMDSSYVEAFCSAWDDRHGWTLWIEGEIPLRRKTADQLEVGTYFRGVCGDEKEWFMYVGGEPLGDIRTVYYAPEMFKSDAPTSKWVVLEELGTFKNQKISNI